VQRKCGEVRRAAAGLEKLGAGDRRFSRGGAAKSDAVSPGAAGAGRNGAKRQNDRGNRLGRLSPAGRQGGRVAEKRTGRGMTGRVVNGPKAGLKKNVLESPGVRRGFGVFIMICGKESFSAGGKGTGVWGGRRTGGGANPYLQVLFILESRANVTNNMHKTTCISGIFI